MNKPTDDHPRSTSPARTAAEDPRVRMPWLPGDRRNSKLTAAGQWWDAVRVPRIWGDPVAAKLGGSNGAIISDGAVLYWLIPTGGANAWSIPAGRGVYICGRGTWVGVPGLLCVGIPHWRILPTDVDDYRTSPGLLYRALTDVLRGGSA